MSYLREVGLNHENTLIMDIYVKSLPFKYKPEQVEELFATYGTVESVQIIKDRATGQSKGFGFVKMPNELEALAAIIGLNGAEVEGLKLVVEASEGKKAAPKSPFASRSRTPKGLPSQFGKGGVDLPTSTARKSRKGQGRGTRY